ncbi:MAG: pyruvate kinase [Planctomycetes bacterium]|nr:pyruvate kinase [Planctomycetota bacterium]
MRTEVRTREREEATIRSVKDGVYEEVTDMGPEKRLEPRPQTKIVATLGPASADKIGELIEQGMSVARINFSHGKREELRELIAAVRTESKARQSSVGILCDLPGPKMRLGSFEGGSHELEVDEVYVLRDGGELAGQGEIYLDCAGALGAVRPGDRVLVADGAAELIVEEYIEGGLRARVSRGGRVTDRKGLHLPDSDIEYELPTPADREWIEFAKEAGADFLGVSFVGNGEDLIRIRALAPEQSIVAKVERRVAVENLDGILEQADGLMIARGDLGVEMDLERLPMVQKDLLAAGLRAGCFTITATEMLESMITTTRPTRAEVTDVANAIFDRTDGIMLSAETAVGENPVEAVRTMRNIALAVEESERFQALPKVEHSEDQIETADAVSMAAVQCAGVLGVDKIVCFSETGNTVRLMSRYRPEASIFGLSPLLKTVRWMTALANVRPVPVARWSSLEDMLQEGSKMLIERGYAESGELIVFVAGVPPGVAKTTNVMKVHRIGDPIRLH